MVSASRQWVAATTARDIVGVGIIFPSNNRQEGGEETGTDSRINPNDSGRELPNTLFPR